MAVILFFIAVTGLLFEGDSLQFMQGVFAVRIDFSDGVAVILLRCLVINLIWLLYGHKRVLVAQVIDSKLLILILFVFVLIIIFSVAFFTELVVCALPIFMGFLLDFFNVWTHNAKMCVVTPFLLIGDQAMVSFIIILLNNCLA